MTVQIWNSLAVADMYLTETAAKSGCCPAFDFLGGKQWNSDQLHGRSQEVHASIPALGKPNWKVAVDLANAMTMRFNYSSESEILREMKERCRMGYTGVLCEDGF